MKIISLELVGYKFLALSNIQYIKITPSSKLQLILGTNGSGKSSLMMELSPLPGLPAHYAKNGSKTIEIQHRTSTYVLKSSFGLQSNRFSFEQDGNELNPGGTITTFKELVRQHFNYTSEIHELMVGAHYFHAMSTLERRNWFTKISNIDYQYAIQYYQKLKEQLRDVQGALKLNQARLVQETEKSITPQMEAQYREEIANTHKLIDTLLNLKRPIPHSKSYLQTSITNQESLLKDLAKQIRGYYKKFSNHERYTSVDDIAREMIDVQATIQHYQIEVPKICSQIEEQRKLLESMERAQVSEHMDIDTVIETLESEVRDMSKQLSLNLDIPDPKEAIQALMSIYDNLVDIFKEVPANPDHTIGRDSYIALMEQHKALSVERDTMMHQLTELTNQRKDLEHYKTHGAIECPKCRYHWYRGYDEDSYKVLLTKIDRHVDALEAQKALIVKIDQDLEHQKHYLDLQRQFLSIANAWTILKPLWQYIVTSDKFFTAPASLTTTLEQCRKDLQIQIQIQQLKADIDAKTTLKTILSKNQSLSIASSRDMLDHLNLELTDINARIDKANQRLQTLKRYQDAVTQLDKLASSIDEALSDRDQMLEELHLTFKQEALNETINAIKMTLVDKEQAISKLDVQKALIDTLQAQVDDLKERSMVLKVAVSALSPTEGLIARGLTGFINHFLKQVNNFIKRIWTYEIELQPIVPSEDESLDLDYKFPVKVNDKHLAPDVCKCSSAQKEIIDLAFKVVSMQYLGLQEFPLFLDEPGRTCDHVHRESVFKAIYQLITATNLSNCFLVSHYEQGYGCMVNTDITVLCKNNIVLPKGAIVNTHTEIR